MERLKVQENKSRSKRHFHYHSHRPEGQQVVVPLAVAPGVPARILSLLQDVHLTTEVHLLKAHESAEDMRHQDASMLRLRVGIFFLFKYLRSTLNTQGAHAVHAQLTHVHALVADLDHATLEVLLVEHVHLGEAGTHRCVRVWQKMVFVCLPFEKTLTL